MKKAVTGLVIVWLCISKTDAASVTYSALTSWIDGAVQTYNPNSAASTADTNVKTGSAGSGGAGQTFQATNDFVVGSIELSIQSMQVFDFIIEIYEFPDVNTTGKLNTGGTLIKTITAHVTEAAASRGMITIKLDESEQFALKASTGNEGYVMHLYSDSGPDGFVVWQYATGNVYTQGKNAGSTWGGNANSDRDFGVAFIPAAPAAKKISFIIMSTL